MLCTWIDRVLRYFRHRIAVYRAQFSKLTSKCLVFLGANLMANERCGNDRRSMTISVTVLGVTLCVVFLAYFAFSEKYNDSNASTVEFAVIVG